MLTPYHVNALIQREHERELGARLAVLATRVRECCRPGRLARLISRLRIQTREQKGAR